MTSVFLGQEWLALGRNWLQTAAAAFSLGWDGRRGNLWYMGFLDRRRMVCTERIVHFQPKEEP